MDGTSRHGDYFVSQLQGSLLTNQFNDAGDAIVPEMLGGGGFLYITLFSDAIGKTYSKP